MVDGNNTIGRWTRRGMLQSIGLAGLGVTASNHAEAVSLSSRSSGSGVENTQVVPENLNDIDAQTWLKYLVETGLPDEGLTAWIPTGHLGQSSFVRVPRFPPSIPENQSARTTLRGVQNEQISAQIGVVSTDPITDLQCSVSDLACDGIATISAENVQIRYVGYVPVENALSEFVWSATLREVSDKIPGDRRPDFVGDPLLERASIDVPAYQAQPIWLTINVPASASPGTYAGTITIETDTQGEIEYPFELTVEDVTIPDPRDYEFILDVWMNPNAIAGAYGVEPWSEQHWELLEPYLSTLADYNQEVIATPIIEEPWQRAWFEGEWRPQTEVGYESMIKWRYGTGEWSFDYSIFDRFVETALKLGVGPKIGAYSMLVFRGEQRITYFDEESGDTVVERVEAGSDRWREVWSIFLEDFRAHLKEKGWFDQTVIAFDERSAELMEEAITLIEEVAPGFRDQIQVAGSMDVESLATTLAANYGELPLEESVVNERREAGETTLFYTAGGQAHPNTFAFSPPIESRLLPWIAAINGLDGYLRWAFNSWPHEVYQHPVFRYIQGDEYLIYPGREGPVSSIRWELLKEGIEDYELVQMARDAGRTNDLDVALDIATRDRDGREKELVDILDARRMILDNLI